MKFGNIISLPLQSVAENQLAKISKNKRVGERLPESPDGLLAAKAAYQTFANVKTEEQLCCDMATPAKPGHKGESHWHRPNPDTTSKFDEYLNAKGNPVPNNHKDSHLYPPKDSKCYL